MMKPRLLGIRPSSFISPQQEASLASALRYRRLPFQSERIDSRPQQLLYTFLEDFLPPPPSYYKGNGLLNPGSHLVYFAPAFAERELLPDGTDIAHAPDASYKYRLWAGGEVIYPGLRPIYLGDPLPAVLHEAIVDVKALRKDNVWLRIRREIWKSRGSFRFRDHGPILIEYRWLVFSKSKPVLNLENVIVPPKDAVYSVWMQPTNALLFRFSALTLNAHALHIDPEYTKTEYGLPGLLVHGPLTYVLMMEVLARALDMRPSNRQDYPLVNKVEYRNINPIFVGEEIKICCKIVANEDSKTPDVSALPQQVEHKTQNWTIWIQKMVNGQPSLCVKASAVVTYVPKDNVTRGTRRVGLEKPASPDNNVTRMEFGDQS